MMILFPNDFIDILAQEIETWKGFADILRGEDRSLFLQMLEQCYRYERAINSKGEYYSAESLLMILVFLQHKIINILINNNKNN
jgi:hypothetical protein